MIDALTRDIFLTIVTILFILIYIDDQDLILVDGTVKLCATLDVDPTDVVVLVLAWHLKAENMCEFTRKGFIEGWSKLG